jgi:hypothetical protein
MQPLRALPKPFAAKAKALEVPIGEPEKYNISIKLASKDQGHFRAASRAARLQKSDFQPSSTAGPRTQLMTATSPGGHRISGICPH